MPTESPRAVAVTGGSSGIGQAIAIALAEEGFSVAVVGRNPQRLDDTIALLRDAATSDEQRFLPLSLDVGDEHDMQRMAESCAGEFGRLDVLVASAGLGKKADTERVMPHPTAELPLSEWEEVMKVNLRGAFLASRAVLPQMKRQGGGQIINVGSSTTPQGLRGTPFGPAYCASKFGLVGLTEALAAEVERDGIRAHVIFPGPVESPLLDQTILARPFGGPIKAAHFASAVVFMVEQPPDAVLIHPHVLPVRGYFQRD